MHTFCTFRYPPPLSQKGQEESQPIRVTNKAMESMLFCIVHSIEFQSPLQPTMPRVTSWQESSGTSNAGDDEAYVRPVENYSSLLGNVSYVSRSKHNFSLIISLRNAVEAARAIPIPANKNQVHFELRVRLLRRSRSWLWHNSRPLVEWIFRMVKTSEEFNFAAAGSDVRVRQQNNALQCTPPAASDTAARGSMGETYGSFQEEGVVYSNDPEQVRSVLRFILKHSYEAIDLNTYADFRSGELVFDVSVQEVS